MKRKIIKIDEALCNGCGLCAAACHEGAIEMVNGKAKLTREDYCDGLGDCLPACPTGAITFEEREAPAYDHAAVMKPPLPPAPGRYPASCVSGRYRSSWHPSMPLTSTAVICSLPPTARPTPTVTSIRISSRAG